MSKKHYLIIALLIAAVIPMSAARRQHTKKAASTKTTATVAAHNAVEEDEMNLASVSKTNPFEIVPAAGMEILGDIEDSSADFSMIEDMLGYARKFMGVRYVHGGRSPRGFD